MSTDFEEIENSALNLDDKSKARLIEKLLQSMQGSIDPKIEEAWIDEINRRKEALKSGKATLHPSEEVLNEARTYFRK